MPREASTAERTEEIILNLTSPNIQAEAYLEVDNGGSWQLIDDIDMGIGINWTEAGKKEKYANFSLTPLPSTIDFTVYNENGKYYPNSGTNFANLFDINTKVRLTAGYILDTGTDSTKTLNLNDIAGLTVKSFFWRTQHSGGTVILDGTDSNSPTHFTNLFDPLYDSETYDDSTYTISAYTVQTYDSSTPEVVSFNSINVTSDNTKGTIYYRTFDDPAILDNSISSEWISGGATENGTKTIDFTDIDTDRFIQVAITYDGITYDETLTISAITVDITDKFEALYKSVYYLDEPTFTDPKAPAMPVIKCKGRDIFKNAIGVDVTLSDPNTQDIDDIIKDIADKVKISYTASSIADLSAFADRVTLPLNVEFEPVKAVEIFEWCMQIINTTGYVMYTEYDEATDDNVLFVQTRPALADTTGAFSFLNYESIGETSKKAGRSLQRITAITESQVVDADVQLDTAAYTTTGAKTLTWSGSAEYKRIVVDLPDNITISNLSVGLTSISFTVDSISGTVNVTARGNKWDSTAPAFEGESIDWDNMVYQRGVTAQLQNPLFVSDAECKSVAESFITQFGSPKFEARGLKWPYMNLIPELNDGYLLWRRFVGGTDSDEIYIITKISHHFDKNTNPNHYTNFNLEDSGSNYGDLGDFIYDDIMDYDKGFVFDMGISTPLSTNAEIDSATEIINNTGF
jgi:hypothetical protein